MNAETLIGLGKIAGIGGIALGVFLFLFRDLLKRVVLSSFTKEQSFAIVLTFMILVWTIALAGIGAWLYGTSSAEPVAKNREGEAQALINSLTARDFDAIYSTFTDQRLPRATSRPYLHTRSPTLGMKLWTGWDRQK